MLEISDLTEMQRQALDWKRSGRPLVFVPTMGFLHDGHASLMRLARARLPEARLVVSIFVNPAQFGPKEDFARYPRDLARDRALCAENGVDLIFLPTAPAIYPEGFATWIDPGEIAAVFEGAIRPGHFRGIATVVLKLFQLVQPDAAVFGQKDAQQVAVIKQLVRDLNLPVELFIAPTRREDDGLAMSSRNVYLSPEERSQAPVLSAALRTAVQTIKLGQRSGDAVRARMEAVVRERPLARLDYADVVDAATFKPLDKLQGNALLLIAARFGATRLIDNEPITIS